MEKISDHITYKEATKSITAKRKGIKNVPNKEQLENMQFIAKTVFEPLRTALGNKPIGIASFFRSLELNQAIGGSKISQHCKGQAIDIDADIYGYHTNKEIFDWIYKNTDFDQLIWEFGSKKEPEWVHVSKTLYDNREETLVAFKDTSGKTKYKYYYQP
jgi:hypothetical protein